MKNKNRIIAGSALGLAAIAVAIDHTKHRLPEPVPKVQDIGSFVEEDESPCGMGAESPCSLDADNYDDTSGSPCGLGD